YTRDDASSAVSTGGSPGSRRLPECRPGSISHSLEQAHGIRLRLAKQTTTDDRETVAARDSVDVAVVDERGLTPSIIDAPVDRVQAPANAEPRRELRLMWIPGHLDVSVQPHLEHRVDRKSTRLNSSHRTISY